MTDKIAKELFSKWWFDYIFPIQEILLPNKTYPEIGEISFVAGYNSAAAPLIAHIEKLEAHFDNCSAEKIVTAQQRIAGLEELLRVAMEDIRNVAEGYGLSQHRASNTFARLKAKEQSK